MLGACDIALNILPLNLLTERLSLFMEATGDLVFKAKCIRIYEYCETILF